MTQATFPCLPEPMLAAANTLGRWLAQNDEQHATPVDLVILAGNAVIPTIEAACQTALSQRTPLLISGGIGHSTAFLYAALAQHSRYHAIASEGRSEAAILAEIAADYWHIPQTQLLVEAHSTNCGENARFSREMLLRAGLKAERVRVVQDPTMQRRTMATFARVCRDDPASPRWLSAPGFTPRLRNSETGLVFCEPSEGLWPVARYLSLLLGEIPRLRDDADGYGPAGRDFITHVTIPADVEAAWQLLHDDAALTAALTSRALR